MTAISGDEISERSTRNVPMNDISLLFLSTDGVNSTMKEERQRVEGAGVRNDVDERLHCNS